jgi:glycosyltransferase involved in cell wall biosynthesis
LSSEYGVESAVIAYGGDQVFRVEKSLSDKLKYPFIDKPYAFSLARIQSDNNIELLCNSFSFGSVIPLVLVGNWNNSTYGQKLRARFSENSNIILIDAIYDQNELNLLRTNCQIYLHGHSAGGTNPALVEAMSLSLPVFAYDNIYNRHTTHNRAKYFSNIEQLRSLIVDLDSNELKVISEEMYRIASKEYRWEKICDEYAKIFNT